MTIKIRKKLLFAMILSAIMVVSISNVAQAYSILKASINMPDQYNISVVPTWNNYDYNTELNGAIYAWNDSAARVLLKNVSSSPITYIKITDYNFGNIGWDAMSNCISFTYYTPNIQINHSMYPFGGNATELISHELGHTLRLDDVTDTDVLMRSSGYKGNPNPAGDDINGVNSVYP